MSTTRRLAPWEFDVLDGTVGAALVSGPLSLLAPYLASLTGALAALALAEWVARRWGTGPAAPRRRIRVGEGAALGCLAVGGGLFLGEATALGPGRGLLLALTLIPLWWAGRRLPRRDA